MKFLILAVLATVVQTAIPVPGQAPDNPTSTAKKIKHQCNHNQTPSLPSPSTDKTSSNGPTQGHSNQESQQNTEHSIVISKLPAVTVSTPKKDLADWGTWIFNFLLVIVGGLQIVLLRRTLVAVRQQAVLMAGSIHVDEVRCTDFTEGQTPIFFVTVVNSGMIARQVSMTMEIEILGEITKYQNSVSMMVPAQGKRYFFITSSVIINGTLRKKLDGDTLRIRGRMTWNDGSNKESQYCYRYNPCPLPKRPEKFPDFVPCDFVMSRVINTSVPIAVRADMEVRADVIKAKENPEKTDQDTPDYKGL